MGDCIFCKIIKGELPSHKLYEDDDFIAILNINPITKGHALLIPKEHSDTMLEMESSLGKRYLELVHIIGNALIKACEADGLNVGVNVLPAAGQVIMHTHTHIIPRMEGDGLKDWPHSEGDQEELKGLASEIRKAL